MNNYHTHTRRCNHATGSDEEYVIAAIEAGMNELGFSDHTPWKYKSNFVSNIRMKPEDLSEYIKSLQNLREKYKDKISIKIGLECEYYPDYMNWLKDTFEENELDYLILGIHYFPSDESSEYLHKSPLSDLQYNNYLEGCINGMQTGLFKYLAHPDLFLRYVPKMQTKHKAIANDIISCANSLEIPLEYNLNCLEIKDSTEYKACSDYVPFYNPLNEFWEMAAEKNVKAIIAYDAHDPKLLLKTELYNKAHNYLESLGIDIIDSLF